MEENEKRELQTNFESNVNQQNSNSEIKPRNKKVTILLIAIIIVLILAIGVYVGLWFAGNNTKIINNKEEVVKEKENSKTEDNKATKKIDETKPWVYDADYKDGKKDKIIIPEYSNEEDSVLEKLIVPYININSNYAKSVNEEIRAMYEKAYNQFGKENDNKSIVYIDMEYSYYYNENILSVVITTRDGVLNGGLSREYIIYNFNLNTLEKASLEDIYKECGFVSKEEFENATEITIANEINAGNLFNDVSWNYNQYYMDKNIEFNLIVPSPSGNPGPIIVKNGVTKIEITNNDTVNNNSQEIDNSNGLYDNLYNLEMFECEYFKMVLPTSWAGKYRVEYEEYGNRKVYMFAENEHMEILFNIIITDGKLEGESPYSTLYDTNGTTEYYFTTRGDGPVYLEPITSMLGDFSGIENNLYIKKTLTNEYGDATKTINVYGRQFISIAGATGRGNIYYINQNSMLCKTNLVDLSTEILASSVKDIQIDQNNIIHAYPLGDNFMNNIAMKDEFVVFENIN